MPGKKKDIQKTGKAAPVETTRMEDRPAFLPAVDIYETDEGAVLVADVPGCDDGSVDVSIESGVLAVRGRAEAEEHKGLRLLTAEYRTGDYERTFTVSELVDVGKIEARVKNGVLRLHLPKAEVAMPRKIQVKTG